MAWDEGTITNSAGELLTVFDTYLVANSYWSIHDASAGTNHKVYKNEDSDANVLYYVSVDDNYSDYAVIELWEGWDAGTHTGEGAKVDEFGGNDIYIRKWEGMGWKMSTHDHRFVFCDMDHMMGTYIGQPIRFDMNVNTPLIIARGTGASYYNPLGHYNSSNNVGWELLRDAHGNTNVPVYAWLYIESDKYFKTVNGDYWWVETPIYDTTNYVLHGILDGVCHLYTTSGGLQNGQYIWRGEEKWLALGGSYSTKYWSLVRCD